MMCKMGGMKRRAAKTQGQLAWTSNLDHRQQREEARVPSEAPAVDEEASPQRCQGKVCQEWARGFKISGALVMGAQSNILPQFLVSVASSCELGTLFTVRK